MTCKIRTTLLAASAALLAAPSATLADEIKVALDWAWRPYHAPFIVALAKGYYEEAGLDVEFEEGRGSNTTAQLVGQGNYDIGHLNITNAAHAISKGIPLRIVGVYQPRTAASFIGLEGKVELNEPQDLTRYRIGSTPGGSDQLSLRIFQLANDISETDLNIVSMDGSTKTTALMAGQVDVVSGDSYAYNALVRGAGYQPESFLLAEHGVPLLGFGFAVNPGSEERLGDSITTFLEVTKRAFQEVAADPEAACTLARAERELPGEHSQCVDYMTGLLALSTDAGADDWGHVSEGQVTALLQVLEDVGEMDGGWEASAYYTDKYFP
ncbi:NitT/TauT family transport system substrate-binding protein [Lutimaribacter pacificus]|uniref:NitT/TauT family transport system substrate-binding protein n=1 Tax=Lutimaribacter pacificus TaxID=391948 RepID=A0A1H0L943_9RHOB|nr:ABC transporter substrate-binding protein [Lutimaribacter pacificus]SDO64592.1 NitT/TauT family transport system substrate-binding protein [Lutimaribacter pacificus]SHK69926.1 NitT/TauT family transport system substrate-binding protein [Lutimaribacter pacificus]